MLHKGVLNLTLLILLSFSLAAQQGNYPQNYFAAPLEIPLLLSGNFGELRNNHFHAGIDIKTQGVEGQKVFASAEGYISRIKIQEGGYGKVLYITHPNGYTTVYAHLHKFLGVIGNEVYKEQYKQESYTIDFEPDSGALTVRKSELIALSGNSGGSGGAHLHFEIRETKSEIPVNPLLFNFNIKDNIPPVVRGVMVYPIGVKSEINGHFDAKYYDVLKNGGNYYLKDTLIGSGQIGFGIQSNDYLNNSNNRCGVFDIVLNVNGQTIYQYTTEKIAFDQSRYLNAHCDYAYKKQTGVWIHKIYTVPNNGLDIYPLLINNGIINLQKDSVYNVEVNLKDVYGNKTKIFLVIKAGQDQDFYFPKVSNNFKKNFSYRNENNFETDDFKLYLKKGSLYDDIDFEYTKVQNNYFYSDIHSVHHYTTPLHIDGVFKIKCTKEVKDGTKLVALWQYKSSKNYITGEYKEGWFEFESRYFGDFLITDDFSPPSIEPVNIFNGKNISSQKTISFKISDDKSGISTYRGELNGQWVLFEYDYKTKRLVYDIDHHLKNGLNTLELRVVDNVGNQTLFKYSIKFDK